MSVETPEFGKMLTRMIAAYGRRVGDADEVDLADMVEVRKSFDVAIADAVARQRAAGKSWSEIGQGLGTTRQAAQMRYGSERDSLVS